MRIDILLIEDNADHADLISDSIEAGFAEDVQVTWMQDFSSGSKALEKGSYSVCLCDLNLPDSSMEDTVTALREKGFSVPIVILTSQVDETVSQSLVQGGVQDFLPKNELSPRLLYRTCIYAIERFRNTQKLESLVEEKTQELNSTLQSLVELNQTKNRFLTSMTHELRTPLNSIIGFSQTLLDNKKTRLEGRTKEAISTIRKSGEQLLELVNSLLEIATLDSSNSQHRISVIEVNSMSNNIFESISPYANDKNVCIDLEVISPDIIYSDDKKIKKVLTDLIRSVIEKSDSSKVNIKFRGGLRQDCTGVCISIEAFIKSTSDTKNIWVMSLMDGCKQDDQMVLNTDNIDLVMARLMVEIIGGEIEFGSKDDRLIFNVWIPNAASSVEEIGLGTAYQKYNGQVF